MPKKILLLDVSHIFYRAFFAIPKTLTDLEGNAINAVFGVSSMIMTLIESEKPTYIFGAKDEKGKTKRHEIAEEYKAHRPEMPSELVSQLPKIFEIFETYNIPLFSQEGYEGDDFLATLAEKYRGNSDFTIEIVSGDHDIFQLVGDNVFVGLPQSGGKPPLHLHRNGIFEKLGVFPEQVADYKGLVGDPSDNLKGIEGVGKKTAAKLLLEYETLDAILDNAEKIPGKLGEKIENGREIALQTRELAILHRNMELKGFNLEKGNISNISPEKLDSYFRKYQFHSLLNRMPRIFQNHYSEEDKETAELWDELEESKKTKLETKQTDEADQMSLF